MIKTENASEQLPEVRFFDLYENQKANLRDYQHNCKDILDNTTNFGYYCIDCRLSFCDICNNQSSHEDHLTIKKSQYDVENGVIENIFSELQNEINVNQTIKNTSELAKKMREKIEEQCNAMHQKIDEYKEKKIQEIISFEVLCPPAAAELTESMNSAQADLKNFFRRHKKFFNCDRFNNDQENATFLLSFDILNEINIKNKEIFTLMTQMNKRSEVLDESMNTKTQEFYKLIDQFVQDNEDTGFQLGVKELSEAISLLKDHDNYSDSKSKMKKYDKFIDSFKEKVFKQISKLGNLREFEKQIRQYDKMHKKITPLFGDSNLNDISDLMTNNIRTNLDQSIMTEDKDRFNRKSSRKPSMAQDIDTNNVSRINTPKRMNRARSVTTLQRDTNNDISRRPSTESLAQDTDKRVKNENPVPSYKNKNDIALDNRIIQRFFAYNCLDLCEKEFRYKENKVNRLTSNGLLSAGGQLNASGLLNTSGLGGAGLLNAEGILSTTGGLEAIPEVAGELDEDDVCKPIAGTSEIQIYDRKRRHLSRQPVVLDKKKHGYSRFPSGVRYLLVEDLLYIMGGRDEFTDMKVFLSFSIKNFDLKRLPDMINARSYHSVQHDAATMSIIVIGGQKNATCELFQMISSTWRALPNMNFARANVSIFNDGAGLIYSFFGMEGDISKSEDYSEVVEVLKYTIRSPKWLKVEYINKSKLVFKKAFLEIFPLSNDKILIYGARNLRTREKKHFAIYLLKRNEVYKVDRMILDYLRLGM